MNRADRRLGDMHRYFIALGSNRRHGRFGCPKRTLCAARLMIEGRVMAASRVIHSAPVGPSLRTYANCCAIVETGMNPAEFLAHLKAIEASFGRRSGGRRWAARVLDLDIILWTGGIWATPTLCIPHPAFRERGFVLGPASEIAGDWRDPVSGLSVYHLKARLDRRSRRP